jgi:flagellar protein FliS
VISALLCAEILEKRGALTMELTTTERFRRDYVETRILSAHPVEIVAMLYEVAIESLNEAIGHLKTGDRRARSKAVTRAEEAIQELLFALDHSVFPSFSRTTAGLYQYALSRMVAGHAKESEAAFQEALTVLKPLGSAWAEVKTQICNEPKAAEAPAVEHPQAPDSEVFSDPYSAYRQSAGASLSRDWSC